MGNKIMNLPEHLGGHSNKTHIDGGAINWLKDFIKIKSFVDVGCGPGGMVELAKKKGMRALGIDGDYTLVRSDPSLYILHDYTKGPLVLEERFDLCWSCEFVEHVEEQYVDNFMQTMNCADMVVVTHAPPGKVGHHHVNCQHAEYWIDVFKNYNFKFDEELTKKVREMSSQLKPFVRHNGLFFVR